VDLPYDVNLSILFTELPLLERPQAAKQVGFDAVEFWWPWPVAVPSDAEVEEFVTAVTSADVQLVGLNFFAGDMAGGDRGLVSWPARSGEFKDNIDVTVALGERLGCRAFNALYGNRVDDSTPEEQDDLAAENLALAAKAAQRIGGTVLVEPVSGAARYPLLTAADALKVWTTCGCCSTSTTWRSTATTSMPLSMRPLAGSVTCRSPMLPAGMSRAPEASTSTITSATSQAPATTAG
jgi:hydroxypyruvate isomerase